MHALKCPAGTHMHTNVHMVMQNLIEKSVNLFDLPVTHMNNIG